MTARKKRAGSAPTEPSPDATNQSEPILPQKPAPDRTEADSRIAAQIDALRSPPRTWMLPLTALRHGEVVRIGHMKFRWLISPEVYQGMYEIAPCCDVYRITPDWFSQEFMR